MPLNKLTNGPSFIRQPAFLRLLLFLVLSTGIVLLLSPQTYAQTQKELDQIEAQYLYKKVPDIQVQTDTEHSFWLSKLWQEKPLLITFFYKECTGSCSPFLHSIKGALDKNQEFENEYNIVSISFDPKDSAEDVQSIAHALRLSENKNWFTGISTPEDVKKMTKAIGFWSKEIPETEQFDHPSLIAVVREGKIVRILFGNFIHTQQLRNLFLELKGFFVPIYTNPNEKVLVRCLDVDLATGSIVLSWGILILLMPGALALGLAVLIFKVQKTY